MKILILSNWSQKIAELNALTAPNKQAYADAHGYTFENVELDYGKQVEWLEILRDRLGKYDVVMTVGCDAIFTNFSVKVEDKIILGPKYPKGLPLMYQAVSPPDSRIIIAKEHISFWPINNDVMIWPTGNPAIFILDWLINDSETWLKYPWLWQHHLWNLMQTNTDIKQAIRIVEAREMNSIFQPFTLDAKGQAFRAIGPSSWQLGDWILHALDMPYEMRLQVVRWGLGFVGDGAWTPMKP